MKKTILLLTLMLAGLCSFTSAQENQDGTIRIVVIDYEEVEVQINGNYYWVELIGNKESRKSEALTASDEEAEKIKLLAAFYDSVVTDSGMELSNYEKYLVVTKTTGYLTPEQRDRLAEIMINYSSK